MLHTLMKVAIIMAAATTALADPATNDPPVKTTSGGHTLGFKPAKEKHGRMWFQAKVSSNLPANYDLRTLGLVPPIKDQGQCGSCWAFASTGAFESSLMKGGQSLDLSEQQIVSCDSSFDGCNGGDFAFDYQISPGQALTSTLPYTSGAAGATGSCPAGLQPAATATSWAYVGSPTSGPTDDQLRQAIFDNGAVAIATCALNWDPVGANGVIPCDSSCNQVDHMVQAVGWTQGTDGSYTYIVKNQWGTSWGDKGYAYAKLGCDMFGAEAAYVIAKSAPCQPPQVRLAASVTGTAGVPVVLSVPTQSGVTYGWTDQVANKKIASGPSLTVMPAAGKTEVYKVWARNSCGTSTSTEKVLAQ